MNWLLVRILSCFLGLGAMLWSVYIKEEEDKAENERHDSRMRFIDRIKREQEAEDRKAFEDRLISIEENIATIAGKGN